MFASLQRWYLIQIIAAAVEPQGEEQSWGDGLDATAGLGTGCMVPTTVAGRLLLAKGSAASLGNIINTECLNADFGCSAYMFNDWIPRHSCWWRGECKYWMYLLVMLNASLVNTEYIEFIFHTDLGKSMMEELREIGRVVAKLHMIWQKS